MKIEYQIIKISHVTPVLCGLFFCIFFLNVEKIKIKGVDYFMTGKELMYVEDALGHEKFMKCATNKVSTNVSDDNLSSFLSDCVQKHTELYNKFLNLL